MDKRKVKSVKKNLFAETGWKYGYLAVIYLVMAYLGSSIVISGNDMVAQTLDMVLAGQAIRLRELPGTLAVMIVAGVVVSYIKSLSGNHYSALVQRDIRNRLAEHMGKLPFRYFDEKGTGSILTSFSADMEEVGRFFSEILPEFLVNLITVVTVSVYLVQMDVWLIALLFAGYPVMLAVTNWLSKRLEQIVKRLRTKTDTRTQIAHDVIQGIGVVRSYNLYPVLKSKIDKVVDELAEEACKSTKISSMGWVVKNVLTTIPVLLCYLFGFYETVRGAITVGELLAYTVLLGRILYPIGHIAFCLHDIRTVGVSFRRLQVIYESETEGEPSSGKEPAAGENLTDLEEKWCGTDIGTYSLHIPVIQWVNVRFGYTPEREILSGLSFQIKQGETIAFVGSSGEGKSTILKLLIGLYRKEQGSYRLYGKPFEAWKLEQLRACFSYVSQNVFLLPGTILENVACGRKDADEQQIKDACRAANIHHFIESLPEGYQTVIGERGVKLSGGEKQRLSLARAFLKDAPILLLDEATAAVDRETEKDIVESIKRMSAGKTVLIVAHRLSTVQEADRIMVIEGGAVKETGTHGELLKLGGCYAALYGKEVMQDAG